MTLFALGADRPDVHDTAYVADSATVIGKVRLGPDASVWPQVVVRGDNGELIDVGRGSNVQDGAILHTDPGFELVIGSDVSIGHQAMLHGCTVGDGCLIGIKAVILNGAVIGKNCLVGAGALVLEGKVFPDNSLIVGVPAQVKRELSDDEIKGLQANAADYVARARRYKTELSRIGGPAPA